MKNEFCQGIEFPERNMETPEAPKAELEGYPGELNTLRERCSGLKRVIKSQQEWMDHYFSEIENLEQKLRDLQDKIPKWTDRSLLENDALKEVMNMIDMVEDNSKMPHLHEDPQTRLYCLAERAREIKEKYEVQS